MKRLILVVLTISLTSCGLFNPDNDEKLEKLVPFRTFLQSHLFFRSSSDIFVVLRNATDQKVLLETIETGGWDFPTFSYRDSVLVGIILGMGPSSSTSFSIDSLVSTTNSITVYSHLFIPNAQWTDVTSPCHIVAIKSTDIPIHFSEVIQINENDS